MVSPTFERVVIPVDFSRETDDATRLGLALASGGELHLMHVTSGDEEGCVTRLSEVAERAAGENAMGVQLTVAVEQGSRVTAIVEYAKRTSADLLLMASHGGSLLTGGVTEQVAMDSSCPVLVLRGGDLSLDEGQPIVVAVDGGPASRAAMALARRFGPSDRIEVVHVARSPETNADRDALRQTVGEVGRIHFVDGEPAPAILELVREVRARLLVAAIHDEPDRNPLEIGRVGRRLIHSSPVPVLIAHG